MSHQVLEQPALADEPVSLAEAQDHLRVGVDGSPDEVPDTVDILNKLIQAREFCENFTGLALARQVIEAVLPLTDDPSFIELPMSPVIRIRSMIGVDSAGVESAVTGYRFEKRQVPAVIRPSTSGWPEAEYLVAVYECGYTPEGESPNGYPIPKAAKAAILLMLGHLYENREDDFPKSVENVPSAITALLRPLRARLGMS